MGKRAKKKKIAKLLVHSERPSIYPTFKRNAREREADHKPKQRKQMKMRDILQAEKILWFQTNMLKVLKAKKKKKTKQLKITQVKEIVEKYLHRYDFELEHIEKIKSMKPKLYKKVKDRELAIRRKVEKEKRLFEREGVEIPIFSQPRTVQFLKNWDGQMRLISNVKMTTFSKSNLEAINAKTAVKKPVGIDSSVSMIENVSELFILPSAECVNEPNVEHVMEQNAESTNELTVCGNAPTSNEAEIKMDVA